MVATILVVEDDPTSLSLLTYLFSKAGYQVHTAADGPAGLEAAERLRPDLVVMDVQMPVMDGFELARRVRADDALAGTALVAVTAVAMVGDREKILRAGFDAYITKPIVPEEFVGQVEELLHPDQRAVARASRGAPRRAAAPAAVAPAAVAPAAASGRRILLVDDRDDNLVLLRWILEPSGYAVETASDVTAAVAKAGASRPDLILSDVHMARRSGWDLIRAVRSDPALAEVPVVLISASSASSPEVESFEELGIKDFIVRPLDPAELLARVAVALGDPAEA